MGSNHPDECSMLFAYVKGRFVPAEEASLSIQERGFRFGDGIFETIRMAHGIPYQWEQHLARINQGLTALRISFDTQRLKDILQELIKKNNLKEGFIRLSISRGIGSQGYLPTATEATLVMETSSLSPPPAISVALWQSRYRKPAPEALPVACKLMQGVNSTLARMEAADHGCFEALQLGQGGQICEGSSSNIFWIKNGGLYTPSLESGILNGTIRQAVLRLSPYPIEEGIFPLEILQEAEEVFLTNVSWLVLPVSGLQPLGWEWPNHTHSLTLKALLEEELAHHA